MRADLGALLNFKYQTGQSEQGTPFSSRMFPQEALSLQALYVTSKLPAHCWTLLLHVPVSSTHTSDILRECRAQHKVVREQGRQD